MVVFEVGGARATCGSSGWVARIDARGPRTAIGEHRAASVLCAHVRAHVHVEGTGVFPTHPRVLYEE